MNTNNKQIKTSLIINKDLWEKFKKYTKENNSDANKEIRKMITNFVRRIELKKKGL